LSFSEKIFKIWIFIQK